MKSRKVWMGIPVIMLVFTVVFGVILTSCGEPLGDELVAKWYTDPEAANDTTGASQPAFEFLSSTSLKTYESNSKGEIVPKSYDVVINGSKFTLSNNTSQAKYEYTGKVEGSEMTVTGGTGGPIKATSSGITYYKKAPAYTPVSTPVANPAGRIFATTESPVSVTLTTTTSGASIKYTTNGKDPMDGTLYSTPISISTTTVLRAIAYKDNVGSEELNETYIISGTTTGGGSPTTVTSGNDTNDEGTLRYALASLTDDNSTITINSNVGTITLTQCLYIRKSVTIVGNGVIITKGNATFSGSGSFFEISEGKTVTISGVHFKSARELNANYGLGGAIYNIGTLTVDSCIFNDNQANYGGAIYSTSKSTSTTVRGCTFYNNKAAIRGGAIYISGGTLYMTGNLFYGNALTSDGWGPILDYANGRAKVYTRGYNVIDKAYGTGSTESGWMDDENDKTFAGSAPKGLGITTNPFSGASSNDFAPAAGVKTGVSVPNTVTGGFPPTDFKGANRTGTPGAVN